MNNLEKDNAKEVTGIWHTIDDAVEYLINCRESGQSVYLVFNNVRLYSADVTLEKAYLQITGLTPKEFKIAQDDYKMARKEEIEEENNIKEALTYAIGSDLHETWRKPRKRNDGTYEPKIKYSKDDKWNEIHGTTFVDIANTSFDELPSNWQYENLESAKVVINLVYEKIISEIEITHDDIEKMASVVHNKWLERNKWVYDSEFGNARLACPYEKLPKEEQDKDKAQVMVAIKKVKAFINNEIDIEELLKKYNIKRKIEKVKVLK